MLNFSEDDNYFIDITAINAYSNLNEKIINLDIKGSRILYLFNYNFKVTPENQSPIEPEITLEPIFKLIPGENGKKFRDNPNLFDRKFRDKDKLFKLRTKMLEVLLKNKEIKGVIPLFAKKSHSIKILLENSYKDSLGIIKSDKLIQSPYESTAFEPIFCYLKNK